MCSAETENGGLCAKGPLSCPHGLDLLEDLPRKSVCERSHRREESSRHRQRRRAFQGEGTGAAAGRGDRAALCGEPRGQGLLGGFGGVGEDSGSPEPFRSVVGECECAHARVLSRQKHASVYLLQDRPPFRGRRRMKAEMPQPEAMIAVSTAGGDGSGDERVMRADAGRSVGGKGDRPDPIACGGGRGGEGASWEPGRV